jgi:hypothetical protein
VIYRCEVHDGRRVVATENRNIADVDNGPEVQAVLGAICRGKGIPPAGCTMRVYTQDRRPKLVQVVSA